MCVVMPEFLKAYGDSQNYPEVIPKDPVPEFNGDVEFAREKLKSAVHMLL